MNETLVNFYQTGHGLPVFAGSLRNHQTGSGFIGGVLRMALPLLKTVGSHLLNIASGTAQDFIHGEKPLLDSVVSNTIAEVKKSLARPQRKRTSGFTELQHKQTSRPFKRIRRK